MFGITGPELCSLHPNHAYGRIYSSHFASAPSVLSDRGTVIRRYSPCLSPQFPGGRELVPQLQHIIVGATRELSSSKAPGLLGRSFPARQAPLSPSAFHSGLLIPPSGQGPICIIFVCLLVLRYVLCIMSRGQLILVHFSCLLKEAFKTGGEVCYMALFSQW